jgi:hypothetical protein
MQRDGIDVVWVQQVSDLPLHSPVAGLAAAGPTAKQHRCLRRPR